MRGASTGTSAASSAQVRPPGHPPFHLWPDILCFQVRTLGCNPCQFMHSGQPWGVIPLVLHPMSQIHGCLQQCK